MKNYIKTIWKDRKVEYPHRYKDQNGNVLILTKDPGEVEEEGTKVTAERMNNIEEAIDYLYKVYNDSLNKVYGVRRSLETSSSTWERIEDAVGLVANAQIGTTPVRNDFDEIYPWSDIITYNYDITAQQTIAYYGDPNFRFDGTNGEVLTRIPEFYWRRYRDSEYEYILISRNKLDGFIKSEAFSVGRYTMSGSSSRVYSRSGYAPLTNTTITNFRTYARNLGDGFGQMDWHYFILQMLYLVEYADFNCQSKLGPGYTSKSHSSSAISGGCDLLGMKSGSADGTDNTSVIYRGIEDIFGNAWQFVDGINLSDRVAYICYDTSMYAVDTFSGGYKAVGYTNASANGYVSKLGYDSGNPLVALAVETSGSSDTNICDFYYQNSGNRIALVGGHNSNSSYAGMWFWHVDNVSSATHATYGARILRNK